MRLERCPEPRLALELRPRRRELVTRVLELAREDALLVHRLASLVRPCGLGRKELHQDEVVLEEQ